MAGMAIKPKQILDHGKAAVKAGVDRIRGGDDKARAKPSGPPETVGAARPGKPGGAKSATTRTAKNP
jgi:hypothetical protein